MMAEADDTAAKVCKALQDEHEKSEAFSWTPCKAPQFLQESNIS